MNISQKAEEDVTLQGTLLNGPLWESEVRQKTYNWLSKAKSWICSAQSLLVIHSENLRKEPQKELEKITDYLGMEIDNSRLSCATKHGVCLFLERLKESDARLVYSWLTFDIHL